MNFAKNSTVYENMIQKHRSDKFFQVRVNKLKLINSYHLFKIKRAAISQHPFLEYDQQSPYHLQQIIDKKIKMPPDEIKNFIWQITKFMANCQEKKINHLRLYPKAIVLREKYQEPRLENQNSKPIFIMVKDFSLGKQFQQVSQGKQREIFQYLHPDLSIKNKMLDFDQYSPEYDFWSLGIILYKLLYFYSPFCKAEKYIFSKTILRQYLDGKFQIQFGKQNEFRLVKQLINKCLSKDTFQRWSDMKKMIIERQEYIYSQLDFHDGYFQQMAYIHVKLMIFLIMIYCMIIEQCQHSFDPFWKMSLSQYPKCPIQILISEFTLAIMMANQDRFYKIYSSHLIMLNPKTLQSLKYISSKLSEQIKYKSDRWVEPKFHSREIDLTLIAEICQKMVVESEKIYSKIASKRKINLVFDSSIIKRQSGLFNQQLSNNSQDVKSKLPWKKAQIILDYCTQISKAINVRKGNILEELSISSTFDSILKADFGYQNDLSEVFRRIYKNYF